MKTKVVNIKNSPYDIYIGRGSKWGNPFVMKNKSSEEERTLVIKMYAKWIQLPEQKHLLDALEELRGKVLGCHCAPLACHGNVLIALLDDS